MSRNCSRPGDALREAQSRLLAGHGEADALRDAVEAERAAVDHLTLRARGLLSSEGHELTSATLERVSETLNAAALDEDLRAQVSDGCLVRELHHVGLGGLGASAPSRRGARSKTASKKRAGRPQEKGPERNQTRSAQTAQARKAEAEARRRVQRTARELKTAQSRRDRAADEFRRTKEALHDAEAAVAGAEEAAAGAIRELEELRRTREPGKLGVTDVLSRRVWSRRGSVGPKASVARAGGCRNSGCAGDCGSGVQPR